MIDDYYEQEEPNTYNLIIVELTSIRRGFISKLLYPLPYAQTYLKSLSQVGFRQEATIIVMLKDDFYEYELPQNPTLIGKRVFLTTNANVDVYIKKYQPENFNIAQFMHERFHCQYALEWLKYEEKKVKYLKTLP